MKFRKCPGGHPFIQRRQFLTVGAAACLGLRLPELLRSEERKSDGIADRDCAADSIIIVYLNGGPSHLDMWDMKPDAPAEIRGEFKPAASTIPGSPVCELMPRFGRIMQHGTLIRSAHHSVNNAHAAAVYTALTGHDRGEIGGGARPTDHPAIGSVLAQVRPPKTQAVPYVSMPFITQEGAGGPPQPGFFGGILGRNRDPLFVRKDPNARDFAMPELTIGADEVGGRFDARRQLLSSLGASDGSRDRPAVELNDFQQKAFDLLTAAGTRRAFRIQDEPERIRDAYGRNIYGQSVLLARRLIEAGTRVACISWAPDANATWDTHGQNFRKLKNELLPQLDSAVGTLIEDLLARGMLDRTIVAVMGDFGRTPKINGNAGRDHWNFCYSLMLFGGGFKRGLVYGASDRIGARPSLNPITPADIVATIYSQLGVSPDHEIQDRLARPIGLIPWGSVVPALIG